MTVIAITMLLSFAMIVATIAIMAIGVLNGRRPISGSCGGLSNGGCKLCGSKCEERTGA